MNILRSDEEIKQYLNIFSTKQYLSSISKNHGWIVSEQFILPFVITKFLKIKRCQLISQPIDIKVGTSIIDEQVFIDKANALLKKEGIHFIIQPPTWAIFRTFPKNAKAAKFGTFRVNLTVDKDSLLSNMHVKHRNVIKRAIKNDAYVVKGVEYLEECYELIKYTFERQNSKGYPSLKQIKLLYTYLQENCEFYLVKNKDHITQGCAIIPFNSNGGYYLYGGSIIKPETGLVNFLQWSVMLDLKARGVSYYDFVGVRLATEKGSKYEGLYRFKSRFGGELIEGYIWKRSFSTSRLKLFNFLKRMKNGTIQKDIIDQIGV